MAAPDRLPATAAAISESGIRQLAQPGRPAPFPAQAGSWFQVGLFKADPTAAAIPRCCPRRRLKAAFFAGRGRTPSYSVCSAEPNALDVFDNDTLCQAELILGLALQLHYREHGQSPRTLSELVQKGD